MTTPAEAGPAKVALTRAVRRHAGLGLADAHRLVSDLLAGGQPAVSVESIEDAEAFATQVRALGAEISIDN